MTPEQRIEQLERQVAEIRRLIIDAQNAYVQSPDFARSVISLLISASSKSVNSEDVSINEAGASTHTVLDDPDGFINIGGYNVPYYNP